MFATWSRLTTTRFSDSNILKSICCIVWCWVSIHLQKCGHWWWCSLCHLQGKTRNSNHHDPSQKHLPSRLDTSVPRILGHILFFCTCNRVYLCWQWPRVFWWYKTGQFRMAWDLTSEGLLWLFALPKIQTRSVPFLCCMYVVIAYTLHTVHEAANALELLARI